MKHLKAYEEFDWMSLMPIAKGVGIWAVGNFIISHLLKHFKNSHQLKSMRNKLSDPLYTKRNFINIREEDGKFTLYDKKNTPTFILDTKSNEISYNANIGTPTLHLFKAKLPKKEFNTVLDGVKFSQKLENEVKSCFIDLIDDEFIVELREINFSDGTFMVNVNWLQSNDFANMDNITLNFETLKKCTKRLMATLDVIINNDFKYEGHIDVLHAGLFMKSSSLKENMITDCYHHVIHFNSKPGERNAMMWDKLFNKYNSMVTIPFKRK